MLSEVSRHSRRTAKRSARRLKPHSASRITSASATCARRKPHRHSISRGSRFSAATDILLAGTRTLCRRWDHPGGGRELPRVRRADDKHTDRAAPRATVRLRLPFRPREEFHRPLRRCGTASSRFATATTEAVLGCTSYPACNTVSLPPYGSHRAHGRPLPVVAVANRELARSASFAAADEILLSEEGQSEATQ